MIKVVTDMVVVLRSVVQDRFPPDGSVRVVRGDGGFPLEMMVRRKSAVADHRRPVFRVLRYRDGVTVGARIVVSVFRRHILGGLTVVSGGNCWK